MKALLVALAVTLVPITAFAADYKCQNEAEQELIDRGISGYHNVGIDRIGGHKGPARGWTHWFRIDGCEKGYVVVQLHAGTCNLMNIYARGGCPIEGLPYWPYSEELE